MYNIMNMHKHSSGSDGMAEWLRRETSELGVPGSNPAQVTDFPIILLGLGRYPGRRALYKCEGLFVVLSLAQ